MNHSPDAVQLREVGPRDGFQNEPERIATEDKVRLIELLAAAGYKRLEVASFVKPDVIPQLTDGVEVLHAIDVPDDVALRVLIPNPRGLQTALQHADTWDEAVVFLSASETHNQRNVNRSVAESMAGVKEMLGELAAAGKRPTATIATAFGCPYEGYVDRDHVLALAVELVSAGAVEVGFGDTTGMANPFGVRTFFTKALEVLPNDVELTAHFHNTRGQGLANCLAALQAGITSFESSFGELGGCPVPPGATGNVASEDLVSMFHEMGVATGIDLGELLEASRAVQEVLGRQLTSHVLVAGPVGWDSSAAGAEA